MYRKLTVGFCLLILLGLSGPLLAVEDEIKGLMLIIEQRMEDPAARQEAMRAGRDRALLCSYCHGDDGNSVKPEVPNLAAQNPVYLLDQINKFARGERENFVMNSLAKEFSLDDKVNLAIYYARQEVDDKAVDEQLAARGEKLYNSRCTSCHGENGRGSAEYARLAGQQPEYVSLTLKRFRATARGSAEVDETVRRSPIMESIVEGLDDTQMEALAAYLAGLEG
ncbi:c-type cytochrome [Thiohalophilus thiocyanatoxydans]|uniref:Cytochrome c553 n=1 Tax=Thiohalophilus thiocyanatoxydans TaxID=381308 RepID=A0A4R8IG47_9GAMM|nr:c-type cytochrome [Thiohalophilus thiocyanatoxydans]TDX98132.1 cytochrome c553 [Thiohalophilus thiocyanatoxydans]